MATAIANLPYVHAVSETADRRLFMIAPAPENILERLYDVLAADQVLPLFFYERVLAKREFVRWMGSPFVRHAVGMVSGPTLDSKIHIAGFGAIWDIYRDPLIGETGMIFGRSFWGNEIPRDLTRKFLQYAFEDLRFEALSSVTPVSNIPARRFILKAGFRKSHVVPEFRRVAGAGQDCQIAYLSKDQWRQQKESYDL